MIEIKYDETKKPEQDLNYPYLAEGVGTGSIYIVLDAETAYYLKPGEFVTDRKAPGAKYRDKPTIGSLKPIHGVMELASLPYGK